jgi:hypothetical protein
MSLVYGGFPMANDKIRRCRQKWSPPGTERRDVHVDPAVMFVSNIDDWPPLRALSDIICTPPPRHPIMGADKDVGEGIVEETRRRILAVGGLKLNCRCESTYLLPETGPERNLPETALRAQKGCPR